MEIHGRNCGAGEIERLLLRACLARQSLPPWFHQGGQAYGLLVALYKRMHNIILERIDVERVYSCPHLSPMRYPRSLDADTFAPLQFLQLANKYQRMALL